MVQLRKSVVNYRKLGSISEQYETDATVRSKLACRRATETAIQTATVLLDPSHLLCRVFVHVEELYGLRNTIVPGIVWSRNVSEDMSCFRNCDIRSHWHIVELNVPDWCGSFDWPDEELHAYRKDSTFPRDREHVAPIVPNRVFGGYSQDPIAR